MRYLWVGLIAACVGAGCTPKKSNDHGSVVTVAKEVQDNPPPQQAEPPNPCHLLTSAEIEALQGNRVVDTKSSRRADGGLVYSQCFYSLDEFAKSISLEVTQSDEDHAVPADLTQLWQSQFHGNWDPARKKGVPIKIEGLGDQAYWTGDSRIGALYVLQGQAYIRLSVGGQDERSEKIETTKTLAQKALARL